MFRKGKFIIGAVVGAIAALAFAPKKGKDLREEFSKEFKKGGYGEKTFTKNAQAMGEDIANTATEVYNDPTVQKHIKYTQKEADKLIKEVRIELEKRGSEWAETAREKIEEIRANILPEGHKATKKSSHSKSSSNKSGRTGSKSRKINIKGD